MAGRRGTRVWPYAFGAAVLGCLGVLALNLWLSELRPGSRFGLGYGIAASVLLVLVALFGARRRMQSLASRWRLGSASTWLSFHLYGGALFFLLVLLHSGFSWPQGALTVWLWILSLWTTASGILGAVLQRWVPKMLSSGLSIEVLYERVPELVDELRSRGEALAATASEPIRALYARDVAPVLAAPKTSWVYYLDITGGRRARLREFEHVRPLLEAEELNTLHELQHLFETKMEIDAHYTLQRPLRWWLYLHVPPACALLVLVAVHVATVLYY